MRADKLNIRYIIARNRIRKDSKAPLMCRITYLKKRKLIATGLFINPNFWHSKQQLVKPPEPDSDYISSQLSLIRTKLNQAFLFLQVKSAAFAVDDIYNNNITWLQLIDDSCLWENIDPSEPKSLMCGKP